MPRSLEACWRQMRERQLLAVETSVAQLQADLSRLEEWFGPVVAGGLVRQPEMPDVDAWMALLTAQLDEVEDRLASIAGQDHGVESGVMEGVLRDIESRLIAAFLARTRLLQARVLQVRQRSAITCAAEANPNASGAQPAAK